MMKNSIVLFLMLAGSHVFAQRSAEAEIMYPINQLFEAFIDRDTTKVIHAFMENPQLNTVMVINEKPSLNRDSFWSFVQFVGDPDRPEVAEPIWGEKIFVDGHFASVWVDYALYVNGRFNHCGVDAFQLMKTDDGWKIFSITDTRRKEDCKVPDAVIKDHEK